MKACLFSSKGKFSYNLLYFIKTKLRGFSPQANYIIFYNQVKLRSINLYQTVRSNMSEDMAPLFIGAFVRTSVLDKIEINSPKNILLN
jgi:hypothetical protein